MEKFGNVIEINGDGFAKPSHYEKEVLNLLRQINNSKAGMLVLHEVGKTGFNLVIRPAKDLISANANPQNSHPWKAANGVACALPGASSLEYSPGTYNSKTGKFMNIEPFFGPDDTLVHELFHKARMMRGTFCKAPTDDPYDNIEEFLSVLVTNIYLSEIGKNHRLRAGHSALIESLKLSSYDFFMKYDMRISILQREMDSFARFISTIDCGFNPIRDSYKFIEAMRNRTGMLDVTTPTF